MSATLPPALDVALKEWAVVCGALAAGRQILLLRKGGIYESAGEFELDHRKFILFPSYLHQNLKMLKLDDQSGFEFKSAEPERIRLSMAGVVSDIVQLKSRARMDAIEDAHVWTSPLIDMRFNYRPENPLYLLMVRVWRLGRATTIENTPAYAGCKSWVPLERPIGTDGAVPVLSDEVFGERRRDLLRRLAGA